MNALPTPPKRSHQARSLANSLRILDAAEAVLADDGWEDASVLRIAEHAGVSRRAVLHRYGDRTGVVIDVWRRRLAPVLISALESLVMALSPEGASLTGADIDGALRPFIDPVTPMRAASEVLIISCHQPDVRAAVTISLADHLSRWLEPSGRRLSRTAAARHGFVVSLALGMLLESREYPDGLDLDLRDDLEIIAGALMVDITAKQLPVNRADFLETTPTLHEDLGLNTLLAATLTLVGELGYESATIDRISAACGVTSGFVYGHYPNKRSLFLDATFRLLLHAESQSAEFRRQITAEHGPGIADATLLRELMRPEFHQVRTITFEQYRLAWHDPGFLDAFVAVRQQVIAAVHESEPHLSRPRARGRAFIAMSRGAGSGMLAELWPQSYALPHDVIARPLAGE